MITRDDVIDAALVLGATVRLTRAVVSDDLGEMAVKEPADRWLEAHRDHRLARDPRWREALDCPYCIGFHLGWLTMLGWAVARRTGTLPLWRFVAGALALNEVAAHLGVAIGDYDTEDD